MILIIVYDIINLGYVFFLNKYMCFYEGKIVCILFEV